MAPNDCSPYLRHLTTALRAVNELRKGATNPETLHRLRTHLRRLEAYLELIGDTASAEKIGQCVSRSSRLRALQVFETYLASCGASRNDLQRVRKRVKTARAQLKRKEVYATIERRLQKLTTPIVMSDDGFMSQRLDTLRLQHAETLRGLQAQALKAPRRKLLHQIRLRVKTIRYQEEWMLDGPLGRPALLIRLKRVQSVLGAYEDRAQFRKWSRSLKLGVRERIQKDWQVARRRARKIARKLDALIGQVASRRLWLVPRQANSRQEVSRGVSLKRD